MTRRRPRHPAPQSQLDGELARGGEQLVGHMTRPSPAPVAMEPGGLAARLKAESRPASRSMKNMAGKPRIDLDRAGPEVDVVTEELRRTRGVDRAADVGEDA